jgi:hypothetical protein
MTEKTNETQRECEAEEEEEEPTIVQNGMVRGVAGKRIVINGVLDLRGVPGEKVAEIERLVANGVVLVDEENRGALSGVRAVINGQIMVADPDLRVMVQPDLELSRAMVEAMPAGQKLLLIGNIYFRPEVPPALAAEKFADLKLVGIIVACEGIHGALLGRTETTGISIVLPDDVGAVVRSIGHNDLAVDYLSRLQDGTTYINIGNTTVADDVPEELLARKIIAYHNVGNTTAPAPLAALLKSRCPTNFGSFSQPGEDEEEESCEDECEDTDEDQD